jgi:uncharacterized protein YjbI with pentapeptide repeats
MANDKHIAQLMKGVTAWNAWRENDPTFLPNLRDATLLGMNLGYANLSGADLNSTNLSGADLGGANLNNANLGYANLGGANLNGANLGGADLSGAYLGDGANLGGAELGGANLGSAILPGAILIGANLGRANLGHANLGDANLRGANLSGANLNSANLGKADLSEANLSGADLRSANLAHANLLAANLSDADLSAADLRAAILVNADLERVDLTGCRIYGASAWGVKLNRAKQQNLIITLPSEPEITVDSIEVAQFVYLLLHNPKIREVIDTIGKKGVLLLGRFTEGRIEILQRLREKLRELGFVPMVFNFDKPETRDFIETVRLLANLSHFVIVDITNPRSAPLELQATVPDYMVPFVPILEKGQTPFAMFVDLQNKYDWILEPVIVYPSIDRLIEVLKNKIVERAEAKFNQLLARRTKTLRVQDV